jgi:hypothetical protein
MRARRPARTGHRARSIDGAARVCQRPVGLNFLIAGYAYSTGGVAFDPSVPLENGRARVHAFPLPTCARSTYSAMPGVSAWSCRRAAFGQRDPQRRRAAREISGIADPAIRLTVNFYGAPAMGLDQFREYRQDLIVGASLLLTAPLGQYDPSRAANLGTNRWSAKPELGLSQALGPWTVELSAGATYFTKNDDFLQGNVREQDPLYSAQLHLTRQLGRGMWGRAEHHVLRRRPQPAERRRPRRRPVRLARRADLSFPLARQYTLKLYANTGLYARTGTDFDTVGIAWQYLWEVASEGNQGAPSSR